MRKLESASIIVVDDSPDYLKMVKGILELNNYNVRTFLNGLSAFDQSVNNPPDLFLLDINMPEIDGFELCEKLKGNEVLRTIPVLFLSGLAEQREKVKAFSHGGVDYITKPFNIDEVLARVKTHLQIRFMQDELILYNNHLEEVVQEKIHEISDAQIATIIALATLAESRDDATGGHIKRTQDFCMAIAEQLRKNSEYSTQIDNGFVNNLYFAAPLHDIGKVGISDKILLKPGKFSEEEFEIMKTHVLIGVKTLETIRERYPDNQFLSMGLAITKYHHEKWNGQGYPEGLKERQIPLSARIMALADVYDALRSKRPYKEAFSHEISCNIIYECAGSHFDPVIVEAFRAINYEISCIRDRLHLDEKEEFQE